MTAGFTPTTPSPGSRWPSSSAATPAYTGYSTTAGSADAFNAFSDKSSVSGYAADAMKWATATGVINGSGGMLLPKGTASRAQVAQIILNFCQKVTAS